MLRVAGYTLVLLLAATGCSGLSPTDPARAARRDTAAEIDVLLARIDDSMREWNGDESAVALEEALETYGEQGSKRALLMWRRLLRQELAPDDFRATNLSIVLEKLDDARIAEAAVSYLRHYWTRSNFKADFARFPGHYEFWAQHGDWPFLLIPDAERPKTAMLQRWVSSRCAKGEFPPILGALVREYAIGKYPDEYPAPWLSVAIFEATRVDVGTWWFEKDAMRIPREITPSTREALDVIRRSDRFPALLRAQAHLELSRVRDEMVIGANAEEMLNLIVAVGIDGEDQTLKAQLEAYFKVHRMSGKDLAVLVPGVAQKLAGSNTRFPFDDQFFLHNATYDEMESAFPALVHKWLQSAPDSAGSRQVLSALAALVQAGEADIRDGKRNIADSLVTFVKMDTELAGFEAHLKRSERQTEEGPVQESEEAIGQAIVARIELLRVLSRIAATPGWSYRQLAALIRQSSGWTSGEPWQNDRFAEELVHSVYLTQIQYPYESLPDAKADVLTFADALFSESVPGQWVGEIEERRYSDVMVRTGGLLTKAKAQLSDLQNSERFRKEFAEFLVTRHSNLGKPRVSKPVPAAVAKAPTVEPLPPDEHLAQTLADLDAEQRYWFGGIPWGRRGGSGGGGLRYLRTGGKPYEQILRERIATLNKLVKQLGGEPAVAVPEAPKPAEPTPPTPTAPPSSEKDKVPAK